MRLTVDARTARRLRLGRSGELARATVTATGPRHRLRLRPAVFGRSRARLRRMRSLAVVVRLSAADRAGNSRSQSLPMEISR